jgi:hypothetical protein
MNKQIAQLKLEDMQDVVGGLANSQVPSLNIPLGSVNAGPAPTFTQPTASSWPSPTASKR